MGVLAWIVGLLLAAGTAMAGMAKIQGVAMMEETRERLGLAPGMWKGIGGLEVLAAAGLIIGLLTNEQGAEWIGFLAAIGLILLLAGAVVYHFRAGDAPKESMPAIMIMVMAVLYIVFIGGR